MKYIRVYTQLEDIVAALTGSECAACNQRPDVRPHYPVLPVVLLTSRVSALVHGAGELRRLPKKLEPLASLAFNSQFSSKGAVLQGGEERMQLGEGGAVRGF